MDIIFIYRIFTMNQGIIILLNDLITLSGLNGSIPQILLYQLNVLIIIKILQVIPLSLRSIHLQIWLSTPLFILFCFISDSENDWAYSFLKLHMSLPILHLHRISIDVDNHYGLHSVQFFKQFHISRVKAPILFQLRCRVSSLSTLKMLIRIEFIILIIQT